MSTIYLFIIISHIPQEIPQVLASKHIIKFPCIRTFSVPLGKNYFNRDVVKLEREEFTAL